MYSIYPDSDMPDTKVIFRKIIYQLLSRLDFRNTKYENIFVCIFRVYQYKNYPMK